MRIKSAEVGQALGHTIGQFRTSFLNFPIVLCELSSQQLTFTTAIPHARQGPAGSDLSIFAQARMDADWRRIDPRGVRGQLRRISIDQKMACWI